MAYEKIVSMFEKIQVDSGGRQYFMLDLTGHFNQFECNLKWSGYSLQVTRHEAERIYVLTSPYSGITESNLPGYEEAGELYFDHF
jgi:hypothetical protein